MMIQFNKNIALKSLSGFGLAAMILFSTSSCTDNYINYNTNPHQATIKGEISRGKTLPKIKQKELQKLTSG